MTKLLTPVSRLICFGSARLLTNASADGSEPEIVNPDLRFEP